MKLSTVPLRGVTALVFLIGACPLFPAGKYAIASEAKLIVVGTMSTLKVARSGEAWSLSGTLTVRQVLSGKASRGEKLSFGFNCTCCAQTRPTTSFLENKPGIWFLIAESPTRWTSAGSCTDPGWRPIEELSSFEAYLKKR